MGPALEVKRKTFNSLMLCYPYTFNQIPSPKIVIHNKRLSHSTVYNIIFGLVNLIKRVRKMNIPGHTGIFRINVMCVHLQEQTIFRKVSGY